MLHETRIRRSTIYLPVPPNRANNHGGWKARHFGQEKYFRECDLWMLERKQRPSGMFTGVRWNAHVEVVNRYDFDNLVALLKWPLDYLQSRGFIESDGPNKCWPDALPTQQVIRTKGVTRKLSMHIYGTKV